MGDDGEIEFSVVTHLVETSKSIQDSTYWQTNKNTSEHRWSVQCCKLRSYRYCDDNQPYLALMGMELAFDNQEIINLKRCKMIFEIGDLKVTPPLDLKEGRRCIELI